MDEMLDILVETATNGTDEEFQSMMETLTEIVATSFTSPKMKTILKNELRDNLDGQIQAIAGWQSFIDKETLFEGMKEERVEALKSFAQYNIFMMEQLIIEIQEENVVLITPCRERQDIPMPHYAHDGDAGMDIYALADYVIQPGETVLIPTGFKVVIPDGYELQVRPRSGMSLKTGLRVANSPGTIDSTYRDEVGVIVQNIEAPIQDITYEFDNDGLPVITSILHGKTYEISQGSKFAQLVFTKVEKASLKEVDNIDEFTSLRQGGFGSTDQ